VSKQSKKSGEARSAMGKQGTGNAGPDHHAELVEIFENRNLLKRELEETSAERDVLKADVEDLRQRHGELHRQLTTLEQMLADPEKGQNAILYYRLQAVWNTCRNQIRALAQDLSTRQDQVERGKFLQDFEHDRKSKLDELAKQLLSVDREQTSVQSGISEMQQGLAKLTRFWHRGKRKRLENDIINASEQLPPLEAKKRDILARIDQTKKLKPPAWGGIGIPARRAINLALLSLAQYLYLHFAEYNISEMARSAGTKMVSDVNFGMGNECLKIGNQVHEVVVKLRNDKTRPDKLKHRTEYLRQKAVFTGAQDTIPEESCLDYLMPSSQSAPTIDAEARALGVNVLRLNYWDLQTLLLKSPEHAEEKPELKVSGINAD
jgi:predicted  nucleic acid-binding Zn-ribbon protein